MGLKMGKEARRILLARLDGSIRDIRANQERNRLWRIWDRGASARRLGASISCCKYDVGTVERCVWIDGWLGRSAAGAS